MARPKRTSFLDELALGRYLAAESPLHEAPPGAKAFLLTLVACASFALNSALGFALIGMGIAAVARRSKIPQITLWRSLRPLLVLAAFTVLAGAFLNHPQGSFFHPVFSWDGLQQGALYAARLLLITLLTTLFFLTTMPDEAIALGIRVMKPMKLLGIDDKELSLLVHLAYRFVPTLVREIEAMRLGRQARNLPRARGLWTRGREMVEGLVALLVGCLHRAESTGLAIEQRGLLENWSTPGQQRSVRFAGLWPAMLLLLLAGLAWALNSRVW